MLANQMKQTTIYQQLLINETTHSPSSPKIVWVFVMIKVNC